MLFRYLSSKKFEAVLHSRDLETDPDLSYCRCTSCTYTYQRMNVGFAFNMFSAMAAGYHSKLNANRYRRIGPEHEAFERVKEVQKTGRWICDSWNHDEGSCFKNERFVNGHNEWKPYENNRKA